MNILWASGISEYAAKDGMGKAVVKYTGVKEIIIATIITCVISGIFLRWAAFAVIPAAVLFVFVFCTYVKRKIGGITGDILGAVVELTRDSRAVCAVFVGIIIYLLQTREYM